ncbi:MAG TPA: TRAP transporter large permease subunit, partial [Beijerinckiaceae bacterium]
MIATALFACFLVLFVLGTPVAVALGLAGTLAIYLADLNVLATPTSAYTGIAKYPLLAVPMFVLVGAIFDRSGVALRLVNFASALIGHRAGSLAAVTVIVSMFLGGISGSGPANAAAVGGAMIGALSRAGYPRAFSASVIGAAAA